MPGARVIQRKRVAWPESNASRALLLVDSSFSQAAEVGATAAIAVWWRSEVAHGGVILRTELSPTVARAAVSVKAVQNGAPSPIYADKNVILLAINKVGPWAATIRYRRIQWDGRWWHERAGGWVALSIVISIVAVH